MAELADALDSGSSEHYAHASSSLVIRITENKDLEFFPSPYFFVFIFKFFNYSVCSNPTNWLEDLRKTQKR